MLRSLRRGAMRTAAAATATAAAVEATTHLPTEGRSSRFYHDLSDRAALPLARRLLGPEVAHELSVEAARLGWAPRRRPVGGSEWRVRMASSPLGGGGPNFPNPIGLAAGFDKDGVAIRGLMDMGFGSVELGSVTPLPQPGNPKPRLFRLTEDRAVINRYGFNSKGLDAVEENLRAFRRMDGALQIQGESESEGEGESDGGGSAAAAAALEVAGWIWAAAGAALAGGDGDGDGDTPVGVLGVNLGKNKTSDDEVADYCRGIRQLGPYADYLVVNISSPNTPGLRGLQRREPLLRLLGAALSERDALSTVAAGSKHVPLLVKIAPDVTDRELEDIAAVVAEVGVDGVVVSNTSTSRPASLRSEHRGEAGGLSGAPIRDMSTECIRRFYRLTGGNVPIVGVGGGGERPGRVREAESGGQPRPAVLHDGIRGTGTGQPGEGGARRPHGAERAEVGRGRGRDRSRGHLLGEARGKDEASDGLGTNVCRGMMACVGTFFLPMGRAGDGGGGHLHGLAIHALSSRSNQCR